MTQLLDGVLEDRARGLKRVDPRLVQRIPGMNPRTDLTRFNLEPLKAFIREHGVLALPPIRVRKAADGEGIELIHGERRLCAVLELLDEGAEIGSMLALYEPGRRPDAELLALMLADNQGVPLSPLEEAQAFQRLADFGWSHVEIARKIGHAPSYVSERLALLDLAPDVQEAVKTKTISLREGVDIGRKAQGERSQREHLETVKAHKAAKVAKKREPRSEPTFREVIWGYLEDYGVEAVREIIQDFEEGRDA